MRKFIQISLVAVAALAINLTVRAQTAVSSSAGTQNRSESQVLPANPPNQGPLASPTPHLPPSLDVLQQAFKQSSLGKEADEARLHAQWRELSNKVVDDPDLVAARTRAEAAGTDLEKRDRLRVYYKLFFERMKARASSPELKNYIETKKNEHLGLTAQNRVRPSPTAAPAVARAPKRAGKISPPPEPALPQ